MPRIGRIILFVAFAFTVMADPVSSVAYAVEASLAALDGDLATLLPTMTLVVGVIVVVAASYHQLIARFPDGGGGAAGMAAAFGEGWAFLPLGALVVDFTLTIAVSVSAASSALIAYSPGLAGLRIPLAAALAAAVAAICLVGHRGRVLFAAATLSFVGLAVVVVVRGALAEPGAAATHLAGEASFLPLLLALPLGMALATGIEAPSNAIAELGELGPGGRRRFGQATIWIMLAVVGGLTISFAALAARLGIGLPPADSTLLAEVARTATGGDGAFAVFQAASALLLLAAAAASFIAGAGLLEALARHTDGGRGLLPARFGQANRFYVPPWGIGALLVVSLAVVGFAGGRDQEIVHFYAVAVFLSFLGAVVACAVLSWRERRLAALAVNVAGIVLVGVVLALNLRRLDPLASLAASAAVSLFLWGMWVRRGRPGGTGRLGR